MFGLFKKKQDPLQAELEQMRKEAEARDQTPVFSNMGTGISSSSDFKMTVADVFNITGRGTVITGKIESGEIRVGDTISLRGKSYNVQGIEMFRRNTQEAKAGDNVGILLRGLDRNSVARGDVLTK